MTQFKVTALRPSEIATAVLRISFAGSPDVVDNEGNWLYEQLWRASGRAIHLNNALRELRVQFPRLTDPNQVVERVLGCKHFDVYLTWQTDGGSRVYVGAVPQNRVLPRGQSPWRPDFDLNDFIYNTKPSKRPVPFTGRVA